MAYLEKIRNLSAAIAFAEAGEFDTARSMANINTTPVRTRSRILDRLERVFAATAFAEGGLFTEAAEMASPAPEPRRAKAGANFLELVGLQHAPVHLVCVTAD